MTSKARTLQRKIWERYMFRISVLFFGLREPTSDQLWPVVRSIVIDRSAQR